MTYYTRQRFFNALQTAHGENDFGLELDKVVQAFIEVADDISALQSGSAPGFGQAIDTRNYGADIGAVNAIHFIPSPTGGALQDGMRFLIKPVATNTGIVTIQVDVLPALALQKVNQSGTIVELAAGDIVENRPFQVLYENNRFLLLKNETSKETRAAVITDVITSGVHFWDVNTTWARVYVQGSGGGGGACGAGANTCGAGGGGGGYAEIIIPDVSAVSNPTLTVGAAGTGGATADAQGTAGAACVYNDGTNIVTCNGGGGGLGADILQNGADGGTAVGGLINIQGGRGNPSSTDLLVYKGGSNGVGGAAILSVSPSHPGFDGNYVVGTGYGYGGSGGLNNAAGFIAGSDGGPGLVRFIEYR